MLSSVRIPARLSLVASMFLTLSSLCPLAGCNNVFSESQGNNMHIYTQISGV